MTENNPEPYISNSFHGVSENRKVIRKNNFACRQHLERHSEIFKIDVEYVLQIFYGNSTCTYKCSKSLQINLYSKENFPSYISQTLTALDTHGLIMESFIRL